MKITRNSRKHERVPLRGLIRYTLDSDPSRQHVKNISEISESGLSFLTYPKLETGAKIKISVLLFPQETPIESHAIVVRCIQKKAKPLTYQASLRFLDISEKDRAALRDFLVHFVKNKKGHGPFHFVFRLSR